MWSRTRRRRSSLCMLALAMVAVPCFLLADAGDAQGGRVLFVDHAATGPTHDGTTWCSALTDLQDALAIANAGHDIRVVDGMYTPTAVGGDREATFALSSGVALYGGYAGCGAVQPDERDVATHVTVLSGDLARDDGINGSELWAFKAEHAQPEPIPTVSEWGLVVMTLLKRCQPAQA